MAAWVHALRPNDSPKPTPLGGAASLRRYAASSAISQAAILKPGRNDPCWCGSGRKFKKCHLGREREIPVPLQAVVAAGRKVWDQKECLHPEAASGACGKVINAHTVQRSRVLQALVDDSNHVLTFKGVILAKGWPVSSPSSIGWRKASTFSGFCDRHDAATFAALETQPFEGALEQCFLLGYRALCYEIYQKRGVIRSVPAVSHLVDRGQPMNEQWRIQRAEQTVAAGASHGLEAMLHVKSVMDRQLLSKAYAGWSRLVLRFRGELCVAATGGVAPNRDLDRRELQVLHDPGRFAEQLMCGVTADQDMGAFVFLWRSEQQAPRRFVEAVLRRPAAAIPGILVQFMFAHLENTYFSPRWWTTLGAEDRAHLIALANVTNPYYDVFSYVDRPLVPWEIVGLSIEDAA